MESFPSKRMLALSERLYRLLLLSYPSDFRRAYRLDMAQTFLDCCRDTLQLAGVWGLLRLWGFILYDLAVTASVEHTRTWIKRLFNQKEYTILNMHLDVALRTDVGRKRPSNEDNMASVVPQDPQLMAKKGALFIVADGLGGHESGEVASEITVSTVSSAYYQDDSNDISSSLLQAVKHANALVYQRIEQEGREEGSMGSACIAAVLHDDTAYIANVGDRRAYIIRQGQVKQVSLDHSWVAEQVRAGTLTEEQARGHEQRNLITRCIGSKPDVEVDVFTEQVQGGDVLVLCTDGLSNLVSNDEIAAIVEQFGPQESVSHLIERANEQGGLDNITA